MGSSSRQDILSRRVAFLKQVSLFASLHDSDLEILADDFRAKNYDNDEIICRQGDYNTELYVVIRGKVRIFKISPAGGETTRVIYSANDVFGEFATIDNQPRSATAKAIEPATLLIMTREIFLEHMRTTPDFALQVAKLLVSRARWTAAYAETIAQYDAAGRLLHILLSYYEQLGEELEAGKRYVLDLSLNQTDLASLVGARREWVNRLLRDWLKRGLIEYDAGKIIILDLPRVIVERDSRIEANSENVGW
jgi:CRP/FNR family cyclic AMP-dependent transcriptional regulator